MRYYTANSRTSAGIHYYKTTKLIGDINYQVTTVETTFIEFYDLFEIFCTIHVSVRLILIFFASLSYGRNCYFISNMEV